jgi:hypothetical protein
LTRPFALLFGGAALVAGVAAALWCVERRAAAEPVEDPNPTGWWTLVPSEAVAPSPEERARELSLPYVSTGARAGDGSGAVHVLRPELVAPGDNLYVSAHAPEAHLVDREGRPLWRWSYSFARAFPGRSPNRETQFWRRVRLLPGGDLLVLVQGAGVFRLDKSSRLLWASEVSAYNDLVATPGGGVLTLVKEARRIPGLRGGGEVLEDFLVELGPDGRERSRVSILRALLASPWASWLPAEGSADLLHSNTVVPLDGSLAAVHPAYAAGNVLLSLREIDALVVLDPQRGSLQHALRGGWRRQHQPVPLPSGELVLFDNRGGERGGSRVLRVDPRDGAVTWEHTHHGERQLRSIQAGVVQALPNGNLLVVESEIGRAHEITFDGEPVWELATPHRMGDRLQFIAYLFDVQRVPMADWLPGGRGSRR